MWRWPRRSARPTPWLVGAGLALLRGDRLLLRHLAGLQLRFVLHQLGSVGDPAAMSTRKILNPTPTPYSPPPHPLLSRIGSVHEIERSSHLRERAPQTPSPAEEPPVQERGKYGQPLRHS